MPRYIDADKAMDEINRIGGHNLCEWETIGVKALIDRQPTADVVEVVRCKDCVNRVEFDINKFHCELTGYYCGEMGYCSDAVRTPKERGGEK